MIVGMRIAARIHVAAQNRMGQRVALALHLPVAVDEGVRGLRRLQRVHHHREIAARGVLHAHGDVDAARGQPVLLVLDRTRTHGHVGEQVGEILVVLRVEHLVGAGESGLVESPDVQFPDGDEALEHVGSGARVRLVEHALVAGAGGAGLVGVDAGHDDYLVGHLLLHPAQARDVVDHGVLPVGGAGSYHQQQFVALAGEHLAYLLVVALLRALPLLGNRVHLLDFLRDDELALENHVHISFSLCRNLRGAGWTAASSP